MMSEDGGIINVFKGPFIFIFVLFLNQFNHVHISLYK